MTEPHALPPGTVLIDEYEIISVLGAGGFGITYLAKHLNLDTRYAVKEYYPRSWSDRDNTGFVSAKSSHDESQFEWGLRRFLEEAQRIAKFSHHNIVRVDRYFPANGTAYMVLSYEEGMTLKEWQEGLREPPTQDELDLIVEPLLSALETLHANGVFHRDLSPDNIFLRRDGSPVLLDFGASREEIGRQSQLITAIIKPGYSPLEQYDTRATRQGAWSDIYAFGAVLYRAITGFSPPEAPSRFTQDEYEPLETVAKGTYRPAFMQAIDWAMRLLPEARPNTIDEWRRSLIQDAPVPSAPVTTTMQTAELSGQTMAYTQGVDQPVRASSVVSALLLIVLPILVLIGGSWLYLLPSVTPLFGGDDALISMSLPGQSGKLASARRVERAKNAFKVMSLNRGERLRMARGLYHRDYETDATIDMDFVNNSSLGQRLREAIVKYQRAGSKTVTGYPTRAQVRELANYGDRPTPWEGEQEIEIVRRDANRVWRRIRALLSKSGDLPSGQTAMGDVRRALRKYQRRTGGEASGFLTTQLFHKLIAKPAKLSIRRRDGAQQFKNWNYVFSNARCYVWTNVMGVEGRSLETAAPRVQLSRGENTKGDGLAFDLSRSRLFNKVKIVRFTGGGQSFTLQFDGGRVKPRATGKTSVSTEVTKKMHAFEGVVKLRGTSSFGGELTLRFSTSGFKEAFNKLAARCGQGAMTWVNSSWAAVYKKGKGAFYAVWSRNTRQVAVADAKTNCKKASGSATCTLAATFKEPYCFALARATKNGWGLATSTSLDTALRDALSECRKQGGGCSKSMSFCASGSNVYVRPKKK